MAACSPSEIGWHFVDLDAEIEAQEKTSILEIFETRGEAEFRRLEREAMRAHVRTIECGRPAVLALGGGAIVQPENFALIENNGVTIWLDCPFERCGGAWRRLRTARWRAIQRLSQSFTIRGGNRMRAPITASRSRRRSGGDAGGGAAAAVIQMKSEATLRRNALAIFKAALRAADPAGAVIGGTASGQDFSRYRNLM